MPLNTRNYPPEHGIVVPIEYQRGAIRSLLGTTPIRPADADYVTERLLVNEIRSLYSHGSRQLPHYLENLNGGTVNPEPDVRVVSESGATAVVDGDGGLGYTACRVGIELVLEKTREFGIGACTTGNHFHIGSAGHWSRMAMEQGFVGVTLASNRTVRQPDLTVMSLINSGPLSIAVPSGDQPPLVLDMGGTIVPASEENMRQIPNGCFKAMGLSAAIQVLGGLLAGVYRADRIPPASKWTSNQGAFLCAWDVARFMEPAEFAAQIDQFISEARAMRPFPGFDRAELPGGMEWQWEKDNRERGIPLGDEHRQQLEELAAGAGIELGYEAFEHTRF